MKHLVTLAFILLAVRVDAQPTYVTGASGANGTGATTVATSALTTSGDDRYLLCGIINTAVDAATTVSGVTFGATAMNYVDTLEYLGVSGVGERVTLYDLIAPPFQSAVVTATFVDSTAAAIGCVEYTGVDQATPHGTVASGTGYDGHTTVVVTSATGETIVDVVGTNSLSYGVAGTMGVFPEVGGQTARVSQTIPATFNFEPGAFISDAAGAATLDMKWFTWDGSGLVTVPWATLGLSLKPAGAPPAGGSGAKMLLLGVGGDK